MRKFILVSAVLISLVLCIGLTSCKAWRTISTTATYTQATDSTKTTTTIFLQNGGGISGSEEEMIEGVLRGAFFTFLAAMARLMQNIVHKFTDSHICVAKYGIRCRAN